MCVGGYIWDATMPKQTRFIINIVYGEQCAPPCEAVCRCVKLCEDGVNNPSVGHTWGFSAWPSHPTNPIPSPRPPLSHHLTYFQVANDRWGAAVIYASLPAPENRSVRLGVLRDLSDTDTPTFFILSQLLDAVPRLTLMLARADLEEPQVTSERDRHNLLRELKAVGALSPDAPTARLVSFASAASTLANYPGMYDMASAFFELAYDTHAITESVAGSPWSPPPVITPERSLRAQGAAQQRWQSPAAPLRDDQDNDDPDLRWGLSRGPLGSGGGSGGRGGGRGVAGTAARGGRGGGGPGRGLGGRMVGADANSLIYPEPFHFPQELNLKIPRANVPGLLNTSVSSVSAQRVQLEFNTYRRWNTNCNAVGKNPAYRSVKPSTYVGLQKTASAFLGHALHVCKVPPHLLTMKLITNPVSSHAQGGGGGLSFPVTCCSCCCRLTQH